MLLFYITYSTACTLVGAGSLTPVPKATEEKAPPIKNKTIRLIITFFILSSPPSILFSKLLLNVSLLLVLLYYIKYSAF